MGLCIDSRKVKEGDAFFCIIGNETDGHLFIDKAVEAGAKAVIHSRDIPDEEKHSGVKYYKVENTVDALNEACRIYYDNISERMTVFGVTGTNGKSTVTEIIKQIYDRVAPCGYIGTIATEFRDFQLEGGLTTPDAVSLHQSLKRMYDMGARAVALEVSSQGLSMGRADAVDFDCAVFTNLTHDHLDYHKTMEEYFEAKKRLFRSLRPDAFAVLNADSDTLEPLRECTKGEWVTYGVENRADYRGINVKCGANGTQFDLLWKGNTYHITTNLAAMYNVYNLLAAIAALHHSGVPMDVIIRESAGLNQIPGRAERIDQGQPFTVIVDYAHTPDGYEKILGYVHDFLASRGRVITMFGASGKRDESKRKDLGAVADKYSDVIILTEENNRDSDPKTITDQIRPGISEDTEVRFLPKRRDAIEEALREAEPGDCVALLGKGDEPYLYIGAGKVKWPGDNNVAREILIAMGYGNTGNGE